MKTLLVVLAIIIIAVITNPSQQRHREVVKEKFTQILQKSINHNDKKEGWENTLDMFGDVLSSVVIDQLVNNSISSNNYLIFSVTNILQGGKSSAIGLGIFGNVILSNKIDELTQEMDKERNKKDEKSIVKKKKKERNFFQSFLSPEVIKANREAEKWHRKEVREMREHLKWREREDAKIERDNTIEDTNDNTEN